MLYDTVIDNTNLPERDTIGIYEKFREIVIWKLECKKILSDLETDTAWICDNI